MFLKERVRKDIPGYEGLYEASDLGFIYSHPRTIVDKNGITKRAGGNRLLSNPTKQGYRTVALYNNGKPKVFKVGVLVAMTFLGHVPSGFSVVVDHIDNDRSNDRLFNLQLISMWENTTKDRYRKDTSSKYLGVFLEKNKKEGHKRWVSRIMINKKVVHLGRFRTELEAHHAYQSKLVESGRI